MLNLLPLLLAVSFLVDMLNDDADEVRCAAILAMARLGRRVQLAEETLSGIVLAALDDALPTIRQVRPVASTRLLLHRRP
jgi:HEAT repeat protein